MTVAAFIDSFDGYPLSQINQKWTQTPNVQLAAGQGRRLTTALDCRTAQNAGAFLSIPSSPTVTVGFAYKPSYFGSTGSYGLATGMFSLWNQTSGMIAVECRSDGHIYASRKRAGIGYRWGNGTINSGVSTDVGVRSGQPLQLDTWQYIEISVTKSPTYTTAGTIEVRVNGSSVAGIPSSPIYTDVYGSSVNTPFYQVGIGSVNSRDNYYDGTSAALFDDVYIAYGDSQYWSCGDSRVDYLALDSDSLPMDWVASDGRTTNRFILLRDSSGSMSATTAGQAMTFGVQNLNFNPLVIHGVQVAGIGHKSDAGIKIIKLRIKSGSNTFETEALPLGSTDTGLLGTALTAPGGGAWTVATVNAMEVGAVVETA